MTSGMDIVNLAKASLGVPYVWGGNNLSSGVDCSGLVQQVFAKFGIATPRVTYDQINAGAGVGLGDLRPGDLVFFATESAKQPDHVGIYMGGGQFIHAPHTGDVVKISNLDGYYADRFIGGRRMPGITGSSDGGDSAPYTVAGQAKAQANIPVSRHMSAQELAETYGLSYAFFQSTPELMGLLNQAVDNQWSPERWTAALEGTNWWKENSETARQVQVEEQSDPATFKAKMEATAFQLRATAVAMGAVISDKQIQDTARTAMAGGWGEDQIRNFLGNYIDFVDTKTMGGQAQAHYQAIHQAAYKNGLTLDDQTVKTYAAYIGRGVSTLEQTLAQVRQQAAGAFPAFAQQIMAGQDVSDIAAPYIQMMAKETGQAYSGLDLFTPQIKNALNRRGQDGQPSPMSLTDFQQSLRSDPDWGKSNNALNLVGQTGHQVLSLLGVR